MVKTKDGDGIKSSSIVDEVRKRACLYDSNHVDYGDRSEKAKSWEEVYTSVVPDWCSLGSPERTAAGKEVQKRWRSIRDSYTKAYRQGKWQADRCPAGSRRSQYHTQMAFLLRALQNKKPRYSQDKYESLSEVSNSPQHHVEEMAPKVKQEAIDKPLDLKTRPEIERPETVDKANQATIEKIEVKNPSLEIKIDANSILPDDHFDDDRLFMNSLLPLFKKMSDDTRLLCRIEVLKVIRYALQDAKCLETVRNRDLNNMMERKRDMDSHATLATTRPQRKKRVRSPSPLPTPPKKRGPGRPRKIRPPPSDSEEDQSNLKKRSPKLKVVPVDTTPLSEMDETLSTATSVAQLPPKLFMQMYNLERSKHAPCLVPTSPNIQVAVKSEPNDDLHTT